MVTTPAYNLGTAEGKIVVDNSNLSMLQGTLDKTGNMLLGVGGLAIAGFGIAVKAAADFDAKLSTFSAVTGEHGKGLETIRTKALQLGRDSAYGAGQVMQAFTDLGKAGLTAKEIVGGVGDAAVQLAAASGQNIEQTGSDIVQIMRTFGLGAKDAVHISDILSGAANASTIDVNDLGISMKYAGAVASGLHIPMEQTADAIAILGNAGIRGSTGGTALRRILLNLTPTSKTAAGMMERLGLITKDGGNAFFDAHGKAKSMADIAQILQNSLKGLTDQQKEQALNTIFGNRAVAAANILSRAGAKGFHDMAAQVDKTSSLEVMNTRLDNLNGRLKIFKSSIETAFITNGEAAQKPLKQIVEHLTGWVNAFAKLNPRTQETIMKTLLWVGGLALLAGGLLKVASMMIKMVKTVKEVYAGIKYVADLVGGNAAKAWGIFKNAMGAVRTFVMDTMIPMLQTLWGFLMANPIFLIIGALVALGVGLYELYKHWKPFHDFVDASWQILQKFWDVIVGAAKNTIDWLKDHWLDVVLVLTGPIGMIIEAWRLWGSDIVKFFSDLPGNLAYAIGYIIGWLLRQFLEFPGRMIEFDTAVIKMLWDFFTDTLPSGIVSAIEAVGPWLFDKFLWVMGHMLSAAETAVKDYINFYIQLPGRIWDVIKVLGPKLYDWLLGFAKNAGIGMSNGFVDMINYFIELPGKIWDSIKDLAGKMWDWFSHIGSQAWEGFKHALFGSPKTKIEYTFENMAASADQSVRDMEDAVGRMYDMAGSLGNIPNTLLTTQAGAGLPTTYIAPNAPTASEPSTGAGTPGTPVTTEGGDTFYIQGDMKTARQISQEIVADKRVRLRT